MKLAEALLTRADNQKRLEQLRQRLLLNARVQEGEQPAEEPATLLRELEEVSGNLTALIQQINRTNSATYLSEGVSLSDALARRDELARKQALYRDVANAATVRSDRHTRSEIKFKSTVNVAELQGHADRLAREYRELDAAIQAANWLTDLVE